MILGLKHVRAIFKCFNVKFYIYVHLLVNNESDGIKMFELCKAKIGYINNLDVYTGAHPTNSEHNTAVGVVDRLCDKIKGKGHCVYKDRWFSSPKIFDHLWGCKT